jgi:hypothetical protein
MAQCLPITPKPEYKDLKAYFNMDNGSGRFHGIFAEGNVGVTPLLSQWLAPFKGMGADHVVAKKTGGTDHVFMQASACPAISSSRTRSITAAACITPASTRWTICAPMTCARPA